MTKYAIALCILIVIVRYTLQNILHMNCENENFSRNLTVIISRTCNRRVSILEECMWSLSPSLTSVC